MANLGQIRSKADFIGKLNPKALDALKPHTPLVFSNAYVELLVADVVRSVAGAIANKAMAKEVMELSRGMAQQAATSLTASWEPGDELCPPWPWPWPGPWVPVAEPEPVPWKVISAAEQLELAYTLTKLAGLTVSKEINGALKGAGVKLAGLAMGTMMEEFEKCGTVPRKPFPKK